MCHVSHVSCHLSRVTCNIMKYICQQDYPKVLFTHWCIWTWWGCMPLRLRPLIYFGSSASLALVAVLRRNSTALDECAACCSFIILKTLTCMHSQVVKKTSLFTIKFYKYAHGRWSCYVNMRNADAGPGWLLLTLRRLLGGKHPVWFGRVKRASERSQDMNYSWVSNILRTTTKLMKKKKSQKKVGANVAVLIHWNGRVMLQQC